VTTTNPKPPHPPLPLAAIVRDAAYAARLPLSVAAVKVATGDRVEPIDFFTDADEDQNAEYQGHVEEMRGMEDRLDWLENQGRAGK
jgi:hypothetical protein